MMKLAGLVDHVAQQAGLDRKAAKKAADAFIGGVIDAVKRGEDVEIIGFGKFKMKDRPERTRQDASGEAKHVPASRTLSFAASKAVRDALGG